MGTKLYVGNLPYSATEQSPRDAFAASGTARTAVGIAAVSERAAAVTDA